MQQFMSKRSNDHSKMFEVNLPLPLAIPAWLLYFQSFTGAPDAGQEDNHGAC
jgi:hypothetical protein